MRISDILRVKGTQVVTVTPDTRVRRLLAVLAEHRVRHAPVVADGALRGIVSLGDVVKNRVGELETERAALTDYITGTR
jgi:CBS domain-containing protein